MKFKLGVERAGEIIFITQMDGIIIYANPMFEKVYGFSKEETLGKTPRILKSGTLPQQVYQQFWDTLLAGKIQAGEIINKTKDNRLLTIESTSSPISDETGKMIGFLAIQRDITERKTIEGAFKESEERLNMAQRIAKLGSWEYFVGEDKAVWSIELFRIFGLPPQQYGPNLSSYINLIHPEDRKKVEQVVQKNRMVGEMASYDYRINLPDGSVRYIHSESTIREVDEHGTPKRVMGIEQDITERKKIEQQLEKYSKHLENLVEERTKQLRDSERLAAIGEIAGMVGHDIRNPLQAIMSELFFAEQSMANIPISEVKQEALESLNVIQKQVEYINRIVADLQDYAKPLKPVLVEVDVCQIVSEALKIITVPNNIQVNWACQTVPKLKLDMTFMMRILTNLLLNAFQAMPDGGELIIKAFENERHVYINVEDTGVGIPKELQQKIFTVLFTTKAKGQGFGLAVVKRLVEAQGGTITFESKEGRGTTFTIKLPTE